MKAILKVEKEFEIKFLQVDAHVRYWNDAEVNGEDDVDIYECPDESPKMPFAVNVNDDWRWQITIDVDKGMIVGWPKGTTARVHYKVCDEGVYTLMAKDHNIVERVESYVPNCLAPGDFGYGDYIILDIDENGKIEDFKFTQADVEDIINGQF